MTRLALIVGSGFEHLGFEVLTRSPTKTPYGEPSSSVLTIAVGGARVACIARHGEGHALAPHEINYRANVWALQQRGVRWCVGINTVGSIDLGLVPGGLAVPAQLIDYTHGRAATFGGGGSAVRHIEFAEPFSPALRGRLATAILDCGLVVRAGTYGVTQGPRLETAAEIERLARDGCTMVGMTAMPEAALARELDLEYAVCAVAVNYAAGRSPDGAPITGQIERFMTAGLAKVRPVLERLVAGIEDAV
ncbi:MAG TPA: S-methyl-5'-thioinosine phosphorylase [Gammaproteobacteria bacterium]|nr:S-methyl-5'-thioinosine phosphorylase [Gammaproteobacteria bacterium]